MKVYGKNFDWIVDPLNAAPPRREMAFRRGRIGGVWLAYYLDSHTCIEGTGRHAIEAGYHVTFLTDAVADFTPQDHRAAVEIAYPKFGHEAFTVADFFTALREPVA